MLLCSIEKHAGIGELENLRIYMIGFYNEKNIEGMVSILAILSQINLMKEKFYLDNESDDEQLHCKLRKIILAWLAESNTKTEIEGQQQFKVY